MLFLSGLVLHVLGASDGLCHCASQMSKAQARIKKLETCLRAIRDYKPTEVCFDEFAYKRLVKAYQKAARAGLDKKTPEPQAGKSLIPWRFVSITSTRFRITQLNSFGRSQ